MLVKLYVENNQIKIREINLTSYKSKTVVSKIGYIGCSSKVTATLRVKATLQIECLHHHHYHH